MANGYGSSSSSSSSSSRVAVARPPAPPGYHYMPDGSLMLDSEMTVQGKVIRSFDLDLSDLPATIERRGFSIIGDQGAKFKLEIKDNTTGYYYNFVTNAFQASPSSLEEKISSNSYDGSITFPAVTGSDDQYDIFLYAVPSSVPEESTRHDVYNEVRFGDDSIDINSSTGSNSLMMQKVIYQYEDVTLALGPYSFHHDSTSVGGTSTNAIISLGRGKSKTKTAFSFTYTAAATAAYRILRQPTSNDFLAFVSPTIGAAPILLPGENEYPTARDRFTESGDTVDDVTPAVSDSDVVRMAASDISTHVAVGDRITSPVTTDTVNGDFSGGTSVVIMDANCEGNMAVGDRITGTATLDADLFTVLSIGTGEDGKKFTVADSAGNPVSVVISDGTTLTFSSKVNRELTTVRGFVATETDFRLGDQDGNSVTRSFRNHQVLTFAPRMNYSWPVNNYANVLKPGMIIVPISLETQGTSIGGYEDIVTLFAGTKNEQKIIKNYQPALNTLGKKPTVVKGLVTVQEGQVVFSKQQPISLAGELLRIGGYGESEILRAYGWEVKLTDLAIALTPITTTTTETSAGGSSTDIAVSDREGVINNVSRVSGIGINPALQNPLITSGGGTDGAGDWTMDAVQTLENGITLTIENTGRVATITGNIEIVKAGNATQTLRFDIDSLLSTSAPS
tara:strand:+ start:697 stop:2730 length:2034 start_codon:yes stop_codon:yes gene_type:complete